jgi:predicted HTH domain antitoxin
MSILILKEIIQATGKDEQLLLLELAIIMFRDYHISSAKAASFANLSLIKFRQKMAKRDTCLKYDTSDFEQESQTLKALVELKFKPYQRLDFFRFN